MRVFQLLDDLNALRAEVLALTAFNAHIRSLILCKFVLVCVLPATLTVVHRGFIIKLENSGDLHSVGARHAVLAASARHWSQAGPGLLHPADCFAIMVGEAADARA